MQPLSNVTPDQREAQAAGLPAAGRRPAIPKAVVAFSVLLLVAVLTAAAWLQLNATRADLQAQAEARNREAALALAEALQAQAAVGTDWAGTLRRLAPRDASVRLLGSDGTVLAERLRPAPGAAAAPTASSPSASSVPAWFGRALTLRAAPGTAPLALPAGGTARVEVMDDPAWVHPALWSVALSAGLAAAAGLALAALLAAPVFRRGHPAQPAAAVPAAPPGVADEPKLLPAELSALAEQLMALQRRAQLDEVSGLPLRQHFLGLLQQRLVEADAAGGAALLLVRVQQLDALNQRLGHETTDRMLGALGDVLQTYVDRVPGTCAGRLNGSDFALCLPVAGVATETAASLRAALTTAPALRSARAAVAVGGVDHVRDSHAGAVLAAADDALAQAEARAGSGEAPEVVLSLQAARRDDLPGGHAWRALLTRALAEKQWRLAEWPLTDDEGHVVALDSALHLQLRPGGPFEPPERWRELARRSRLLPQLDLVTAEQALQAAVVNAADAGDAPVRAVAVSPGSLALAGFIADMAARLATSPQAAKRLWLVCSEAPANAAGLALVASAAAAWRPCGVRLGVRLGVGASAARAPQLPALHAAGVQLLWLDALPLQDVTHDADLRLWLQGLTTLAHGLGMNVQVAGGAVAAAEAAALHALGVDAVAGPQPANA